MGLYNIKNWWLTASLLLLPAVALGAQAPQPGNSEENRWFQVELIVFAHKSDDPLDSEIWPKIAGLSLPPGIVDLSLPGTTPPQKQPEVNGLTLSAPMPVAFQMLKPEELELNDDYKRLARSSSFEPLLHVGWRQPTFDKDKAQTVFLYDGMTNPVSETDTGAGSEETALDIGPNSPRVVGTVSLSVSRYLHFNADLVYRTSVEQQRGVVIPDLELWDKKPFPTLSQHQGPAYRLQEWSAIRDFRLQESRRMRSKKLHYLDNPFFGIIVLVTPVELPKPPEEPVSEQSSMPTPSTKSGNSIGNISSKH